MKKTVAFLLCFCMILPLSACFRIDQPSDKIDAPVFDLDTTEGLDFIASPDAEKNEPAEKPQENTETPSQSFQNETLYYKTEDVGNGKTKYTVYSLGETEVFSGETDKPIAITMLSNFVIKICIGQNSNTVFKFYDLINDRFSEEYSNLLTYSDELAVCVEKETSGTRLVAKSLFGTDIYKEYILSDVASTLDPFRTHSLYYGKLWLTYDTASGTARRTVLPILEPNHAYFTDYGSIVRLTDEICFVLNHYEDNVDYPALLGITDGQEREIYDKLFSSLSAFYPPQAERRYSIDYAVKDLNHDGIFELILLRSDYEVIAIFSKVDGKPVLLEYYAGGNICVDHRGWIYVYNRINAYSCSIRQIAEGGASLEEIAEFGYEGGKWINNVFVVDYYKIENGRKVSISREEYDSITAGFCEPSYSITQYVARLNTASLWDCNIARQADARQAYLDALNGRIKVYNTITDEQIYLRDCKTPYLQTPILDVADLGYAQVDLDADGVQEFVINCGDTLILRYYEGRVYLYEFTFRNMYYLNANGTYNWNHNGVDFAYGQSRLTFDGAKRISKDIWRIVNDGEPNAKYYIGIQRVSKEELLQHLQFLDDLPQTERLTFAPLRLPIEPKVTPAEAWELANAHWRDADGESTGACGTILTARVFLQADPYDDVGDYHFVLLSEHRHSFGDVEGCSDVCHVSILEQVLVDAMTGACKPYVVYGGYEVK